tara:strand:+ start:1549 stop:1707 length:159 start_codon:yes stop_codon:yes gene_type:complete
MVARAGLATMGSVGSPKHMTRDAMVVDASVVGTIVIDFGWFEQICCGCGDCQ